MTTTNPVPPQGGRSRWRMVAAALVAACLGLVPLTMDQPPALRWWSQAIIGVVILALIALSYRPFLGPVSRHVLDHLGQAVVLLMLFGLTWAWVGTGLGIPNLIWSEEPPARFFSACGATLLLAMLGANAFYLQTGPDGERPDRAFEAAFLDRTSLRLPFGSWLEPRSDSSLELSRSLRVARLPFLLLLSLPALLPSLFPGVPRHFGRGEIGPASWASGIAVWACGLVVGVFVVKVLIKVKSFFALSPDGPGRVGRPSELDWYIGLVAGVYTLLGLVLSRIIMLNSAFSLYALLGLVAVGMLVYARGLAWPVLAGATAALVICLVVVFNPDPSERSLSNGVALISSLVLLLILVPIALGRLARMPGISSSRPRVRPPTQTNEGGGVATARLSAVALPVVLIFAWFWQPMRDAFTGLVDELENLPLAVLILGALTFILATIAARRVPPQDGLGRAERIRARRKRVTLAAVGCWILLVNSDPYKERFAGLSYQGPATVKDRIDRHYPYDLDKLGGNARRTDGAEADAEAEGSVDGLLSNAAVLERWRDRLAKLDGEAQEGQDVPKPKLVIVCVSGGAVRSAYWSTVVLDRLGQAVDSLRPGPGPSFHDHVRIITGASGGMVGASYYVAHGLDRDSSVPLSSLYAPDGEHAIPRQSLDPLARFIALQTPWRMLLPRLPWSPEDRGTVLEKDWKDLAGITMGKLREREALGEIPSLIFVPMIVDDGRRLGITNLDLMSTPDESPEDGWQVPLARCNDLDNDNNGSLRRLVSISALELGKLVDDFGSLGLAEAARMSATFPFVSPAVALPTAPPLRVVDAGYYDNFGVHLACAWLMQNRPWLVENTSGVLVVQIRDAMSVRDRRGVPGEDPSALSQALAGMQCLTSVVAGVKRSRFSTNAFRNDHELRMVNELFRGKDSSDDFVSTVIFESSARVGPGSSDIWPGTGDPTTALNANSVAMTWYLSRAEVRALQDAIPEAEKDPDFPIRQIKAHLFPEPGNTSHRTGSLADYQSAFRWTITSLEGLRDAEFLARMEKTDFGSLLEKSQLSDGERELIRLTHVKWISDQTVDEQVKEDGLVRFFEQEFERAMNFERLEAVKRWWAEGGAPADGPDVP